MCQICDHLTFIMLCYCVLSCVFYRLLNSTFVQCRAGDRLRLGTGPVVFSIDNAVFESENDFAYTDDPQVFSVTPNDVIRRYSRTSVIRTSIIRTLGYPNAI